MTHGASQMLKETYPLLWEDPFVAHTVRGIRAIRPDCHFALDKVGQRDALKLLHNHGILTPEVFSLAMIRAFAQWPVAEDKEKLFPSDISAWSRQIRVMDKKNRKMTAHFNEVARVCPWLFVLQLAEHVADKRKLQPETDADADKDLMFRRMAISTFCDMTVVYLGALLHKDAWRQMPQNLLQEFTTAVREALDIISTVRARQSFGDMDAFYRDIDSGLKKLEQGANLITAPSSFERAKQQASKRFKL